MKLRIGSGIDFHQLVEGRDLWIGGIKIPHTKGALGHSDADVLLHAICDALLGALSLGDIGTHFPDTDNAYKNIDSDEHPKKFVLGRLMNEIDAWDKGLKIAKELGLNINMKAWEREKEEALITYLEL
jgi:2-C-methyl-D-erythritol 2,4-cyclodiphosphate synthase